MHDADKSKEQLIQELVALRQQHAAWQAPETQPSEMALRESEARYRALVEGSIQGMCITQEFVIQFANQSMATIFGYTRVEDLIGHNILMVLAPHEHPRMEQYNAARMRDPGAAPSRYEVQGRSRDGTLLWIEGLVSVVSWNRKPATLTTFHDISERKQAGKALRETAEQYRTLIEHANDPIVVLQHGNRVYQNPAHETLLGYTVEETANRSFLDDIGTFHEMAKVVNSVFGETWRIAEFRSTNCQLACERCLILGIQHSSCFWAHQRAHVFSPSHR